MSDEKKWRTIPFYKSINFLLSTLFIVALFFGFYGRAKLFILLFVLICSEFTTVIHNVSLVKTTDACLAVTRGYQHLSIKWENIRGYSLKKSCVTLKTDESDREFFYIDRIIEREEFLAFLESMVNKNSQNVS